MVQDGSGKIGDHAKQRNSGKIWNDVYKGIRVTWTLIMLEC